MINNTETLYEAPAVMVLALAVESCCLTSSVRDTLLDMQGNSIYDEEF